MNQPLNQPSFFPEERRNAGLFSQYYLDEILIPTFGKDASGAKAVDLGDSYFRNKFELLEAIVLKNEELASMRSERQLEDDVIQPILRNVLGHVFDVAPRKKNDIPDYAFFNNEEDKQLAIKLTPHSKEYKDLNIGILDAKAWKQSRKAGIADEANISQIFRYLANYSKKWGALTDGFRWMLFCNKIGIRQDQYIEFDLSKIIRDGNGYQGKNFRLFIYLFRREAFEWRPGSDAILDKVLDESIQNATKLQNNLKSKVYEAFGIVAEEYRRRNNLKLETKEEIEILKETSLIFLYRILFLLYGESRLILPIRPTTEPYYTHSLERILDEIEKDRLQQNGTHYWHRLNELFALIHGLEPDGTRSRLGQDIGLPAYDGGLFDPQQYKQLDKWQLGDKTIKEVTDLLAYTGDRAQANESKRVRVSYRDLGVQHLGNIYEGILENQIVYKDGAVSVENDKGERHATGSYYTPDYIVDYIVKETLEPIVDEVVGAVKPVKKRKSEADVEESILRIRVLDPAMGSGHFLIGAIDFLAKYLAEKGNKETKYTEAELQECRRRIAERCIYGVDLNPMAVELAKLSIWLHTLSQSKPLTFLDNHVKCGNSLIGARLEDLKSLPEKNKKQKALSVVKQVPMFPENLLTQEIKIWLKHGEIFRDATETIADVKAKEQLEDEINEHRKKYKHLADLWTARYFLDAPDSEISILLRGLADAIVVNADEAPLPQSDLLTKALRLAGEKRFFHWELEFPEMFFDSEGQQKGEDAGFDAVIGNPPYVYARKTNLVGEKPYISKRFETAKYQSNLYVLFLERSKSLLRSYAQSGFIVPNGWLGNLNLDLLRHFLIKRVQFESLIRTPPGTFEGVSEEMVIFTFSVPVQNRKFKCGKIDKSGAVTLKESLTQTMFLELEGAPISISATSVSFAMLKKCIASSEKLVGSNLTPLFRINRGVNPYDALTGQSEETIKNRIYNANYKKDKTFVPELKGVDVNRYEYSWSGKTWISYGEWLAAPRSPEFFTGRRILARQVISKTLLCTAIEEEFVTDQSVYIALPESELNLHFILSILNSKLLGFLFRIKYDEFDQIFPKIKVEQFEGLPIRRISSTTPKKDREKLTLKLITQSENVLDAEEHEELIKQSLAPTIELAKQCSKEKNDVLHDFLSHLAEQMLAMNKKKQTVTAEFCERMQDYGIPAPSEMKPTKFFDELWKKKFENLLAHLDRNKVKFSIEYEDRLRKRFNAATQILLPLEQKITLTDWLIDQVVYALYGLTDEEIAIVQGS